MPLYEKIRNRILSTWWKLTIPTRLRSLGVEVSRGCRFYGMPIVSLAPNSRIILFEGVTICSDSRFTALGVNHPTVLRTLHPNAEISIGRDTGISGGSICAAKCISIGMNCLIGADTQISDTDFHAVSPLNRRHNSDRNSIPSTPITIKDNVFIGSRSIILKGAFISENSIVGAGSVVTGSIPENRIFAGVPARQIGQL